MSAGAILLGGRRCPGCGCSDEAPCIEGCAWTSSGLCTACVDEDEFVPGRCIFCGLPDCTRMGGYVVCIPPSRPTPAPDPEVQR